MPVQLIGLILVLCLAGSVSAQGRKPNARQPNARQPNARTASKDANSCVDVASFRQGKPARGLIVPLRYPSAPDTVLMIVDREELKRDNAALYTKAARSEMDAAKQAWTQLQERLEKELSDANLAAQLKSLYERELARAVEQSQSLTPDALNDVRLMWLEFGRKEASNVRQAPPEARRVAIWAWQENLDGVTRRDQAVLQRELEDAGVKVSLKLPDLSKQLPPRPQSDQEWAARLALFRHSFNSGLEFQGSNGVYLRSGQQMQATDMAALVQKMMGGSVESLLAELDPAAKASSKSNKEAWFQSVIADVEAAGRSEYRITRLDQDPSGAAATVETALVAKLPNSGWRVLWSVQETIRADQISAEAEKQIAEDPQVKSVLSLLSSLGTAAEAEVKKAIRFGAATQAAQKSADRAYAELRDTFVQRLDGPPL